MAFGFFSRKNKLFPMLRMTIDISFRLLFISGTFRKKDSASTGLGIGETLGVVVSVVKLEADAVLRLLNFQK